MKLSFKISICFADMIQLNKRMKVGDAPFFDPIVSFIFEIDECFFEYLSGSELLVASEVSSKWNKIIGNSTKAMAKIQLVIKEHWKREFTYDIMKNSERKYANVKVEELLRSRNEVSKFLQEFAESIVSVDTRFDIEMDGVMLPNLKSLVINTRHTSSYVQGGLMTAATNLEKLCLSGASMHPQEIIECLVANTELKELVFESEVQTGVLPNLTYEIGTGFQLKSLKLDSINNSEEVANSFASFMRSQADSIEEIKILQCSFLLMTDIFNNMKNLKRVTYGAVQSCQSGHRALKVNTSIVELNLVRVNELIMKAFVAKLPKLQKLHISDPTWRMFDFVTYKVPSLRFFSFAYLDNCNKTLKDAIAHHQIEGRKYDNVTKGLVIMQT